MAATAAPDPQIDKTLREASSPYHLSPAALHFKQDEARPAPTSAASAAAAAVEAAAARTKTAAVTAAAAASGTDVAAPVAGFALAKDIISTGNRISNILDTASEVDPSLQASLESCFLNLQRQRTARMAQLIELIDHELEGEEEDDEEEDCEDEGN